MDSRKFSCSICLDLLKEPVTIPCRHSYCMRCVKVHGMERIRKESTDFIPRPVLVKSIVLAELVEELKKTEFQAASADICYAGAEDVSCDVCSGRKLKAVKSCLNCLVSYCEKHLQPHYEAPPLQKHQLVEPSKKLQENICPRHDEVMKIFCLIDQQCICYLCLMGEHKGHETISAAAGRAEKQRELEASRQQIQQRIQEREKDVKLLQQQVEAIDVCADKTQEDSEKIFTQLLRLIQKIRFDVKQQLRSQQEAEVNRVKELQQNLELTELKRTEGELEDHNQFIHDYPSVSALMSLHSSSIKTLPLRYIEDLTAAVEEFRNKLQDVLREDGWKNIQREEPEPEPETKDGFLKHSEEITLDPKTAHRRLLLSDGNRKVTLSDQKQFYPDHPDRFTDWWQVLSRESLSGRCYWEVGTREKSFLQLHVQQHKPLLRSHQVKKTTTYPAIVVCCYMLQVLHFECCGRSYDYLSPASSYTLRKNVQNDIITDPLSHVL